MKLLLYGTRQSHAAATCGGRGRHRGLRRCSRRKGVRVATGNERVDLLFTDPPYNVPFDGHVCGSGRIRHREFALGAGEMSSAEFAAFLEQTLGPAAERRPDGAIAFVCMDWRHAPELTAAGKVVFAELKNLCVWNKSNVRDRQVSTGPSMNWSSSSRKGPRRT